LAWRESQRTHPVFQKFIQRSKEETMPRIRNTIKSLMLALVGACTLLAATTSALADKLHLKDGRVLEGEIIREGEGFVYFKVKVGSIEQEQFFMTDQIVKIERDTEAAPAKTRTETASKSSSSASKAPAADGVRRIAIMNFGPPSSWQNEIDTTVGIQISADAWKRAVPLLEKDGVTDVVVRINSGGGLLLELQRFMDVYEKEYKPKFRTVAWIESAISAAAMSPWVLEEFYFLPEGNIGACTGFSGRLNAIKGPQLEMVLYQMEEASRKGKKDPKIMRAMQIQEPLSATIDERTGQVTWFQDVTSGDHLVNPVGQVLTITANEAVKLKLGKAVVATPDELARARGYQEYVWAGNEAIAFVDKNMRDNDKADKNWQVTAEKYQRTVGVAAQIQDRQRRGAEVGIARRHLAELKRLFSGNPNFALMYGTDEEWFREQEELLKRLMR